MNEMNLQRKEALISLKVLHLRGTRTVGSVRLVRAMLCVKKLIGCDLDQIFNLLLCGFLPFLLFLFWSADNRFGSKFRLNSGLSRI